MLNNSVRVAKQAHTQETVDIYVEGLEYEVVSSDKKILRLKIPARVLPIDREDVLSDSFREACEVLGVTSYEFDTIQSKAFKELQVLMAVKLLADYIEIHE